MNKKLIALAGLLAVCGFMTGCGKKCATECSTTECSTKDRRMEKTAKKGRFNRDQRAEDPNYS